jgi:RTX calcium-binding nonapeptide repeat (4 copies)
MSPLSRVFAALASSAVATALLVPCSAAQAKDFNGADRADSVVGTRTSDSVRTGAGNDRVASRGGDDHVSSGPGHDLVDAGSGFDEVFGGRGRDVLVGGSGDDVLVGGTGPDAVRGGQGADLLFPGPGLDKVAAGDGDDVVYLDHDDLDADTVDCGAGTDTVVYDGAANQSDVLEDCEVLERSDGPMKHPGSWFHLAYGYSDRDFTVGDRFTDGFSVLYLTGDQPAVIDDVRLIGNRGFKHLGTMIVGPGREIGAVQMVRHWPPTSYDYGGGDVIDAEGASISPVGRNSWGWELLIGMAPHNVGHNARAGFAVSYTVGGVRYRHEEYGEIVICAKDALGTRPRRCRR